MIVKRVNLSGAGICIDGLRYILEMLDENSVITDIVSIIYYNERTQLSRCSDLRKNCIYLVKLPSPTQAVVTNNMD